MNTRTVILMAALVFLLSQCVKRDYELRYNLHFKNASDYIIDVSEERYLFYVTSGGPDVFPLAPGEERYKGGIIHRNNKNEQVSALVPYCMLGHIDSIRIYFNKGKADEQYITYKEKRGFKPRDLRNPEEYRFERIIGNRRRPAEGMFYYTFTNEDYENAIKNQNATPTPIPKCEPRTPCYTEGGVVCYE